MKTRLLALLCLAALAACGADGPPEPRAGTTGLSVTGEAKIGVSGRL